MSVSLVGAVTFAHPKLGGQFHVNVDGTLINATSGTEIKPDQAAEYLRGFHSNSKVQAEKGSSARWQGPRRQNEKAHAV